MTQQEPPKIAFPCADYPVKILGVAGEEYYQSVLDIIEIHAQGFDRSKVRVQASSKGKFHSITVFIVATGLEQLQNLHEALKQHPDVKMVM